MRTNGNGEYALTKRALVVAGLVLTIIGMVAGMAVAWGSVTQAFGDHANDTNIHWCKSALDEAYVPRGEVEAKLDAVLHNQSNLSIRLERMEANLWEATH